MYPNFLKKRKEKDKKKKRKVKRKKESEKEKGKEETVCGRREKMILERESLTYL